MPKFNSIIVFDTETTGLPCFESNKTRITELAFYGCEVEHLKSTKIFPRVLHKLVLCFNPLKVIYPDSSQLTGVYMYTFFFFNSPFKNINTSFLM